MNLTVFGATGGIGRHLVAQAVAQGHTVTALVRTPAAFPLSHERLSLVQGDVRDADAVSTVVNGQDAILSTLGTRERGPVTLCTDGIERILTAMAYAQVRRLLVVSAYGAAESHHHNLYNLLLWSTLREKMFDKERMEDRVKHSDSDWTLVRPSFLTDGPRTGHYRCGTDLRMHIFSHISRANVADCMLHYLTDPTSLHQVLALTA